MCAKYWRHRTWVICKKDFMTVVAKSGLLSILLTSRHGVDMIGLGLGPILTHIEL